MSTLADHIREAAWTHGNALRKPEVALAVARAYERPPEPDGVTFEDGTELRHEDCWLIQDRGRTRELRLRVARGVIKDIKPNREPRDGREL